MTVDLEALRKKYEEATKSKENFSGDSIFYNIPDESTVRVLPWKDEEKQFYAETKIHRVPTDGGGYKNYQCRRIHNEECPLCDTYFQLWERHNDEAGGDKKMQTVFSEKARAIKPRARYYMNVFVRDGSPEKGKVKVLSSGIKLFEKIAGNFFNEDYGPDFIDLDKGFDYKIIKKMTEDGRWPRYDDSQPRPRPLPLSKSKAEVAAIMDSLHDIHSLVALEKYEDVKRASEEVWAACAKTQSHKPSNDDKGSSENYLDKLRD